MMIALALLTAGCGGGGGSAPVETPSSQLTNDTNDTNDTNESASGTNDTNISTMSLYGVLRYERVPVDESGRGLDYEASFLKPVRYVRVEAIGADGRVLARTTSDADGKYAFDLPSETQVRVRAYAYMEKEGKPAWKVAVKDNTDNDLLYAIEGALAPLNAQTKRRDLTAISGWNEETRTLDDNRRSAAPFAVLDTIYEAMSKVLSVDADAVFPPLSVFWSPKNTPGGTFDPDNGEIVTSLYIDGDDGSVQEGLYILGKKDVDTDEYDDHVIAHEWGHYYEDKLSRADSIGGNHSDGDYLDIRVAFSEGFCNAFSAIALNNPVYFDTSGPSQGSGFQFDMEAQTPINPGWFSEGSVQRIVYDIYDEVDDNSDRLHMGYAPIHEVLTGTQKTTKAFTSLFSFIHGLKRTHPSDASAIDAILGDESIAPIEDDYGSGRTNLPEELPYVSSSDASAVCTTSHYGTNGNNLGNHRYFVFSVNERDNYEILVSDNATDPNSDPDFSLYRVDNSFTLIGESESYTAGEERRSFVLDRGEYLLDIAEYNLIDRACFSVSVQ